MLDDKDEFEFEHERALAELRRLEAQLRLMVTVAEGVTHGILGCGILAFLVWLGLKIFHFA